MAVLMVYAFVNIGKSGISDLKYGALFVNQLIGAKKFSLNNCSNSDE